MEDIEFYIKTNIVIPSFSYIIKVFRWTITDSEHFNHGSILVK